MCREELLKKTVQQFQEAAPDYSAMTVAQLKDVLSSRGIAFDATAKKADLAALLEKGEAEE